MKLFDLERIKLEASFWLGRRLPTCQQVLPVLSQSLERRLTLREHVTLRLHFIICVYCIRYLKQIRFLRDAVRNQTASESATSPSLSPDARERIRRTLTES